MAKAEKVRIGTMPCIGCQKEVPVNKLASGKLSAPCTWCDFTLYAVPGTEIFKTAMAKVKVDPTGTTAAEPAAAAEPKRAAGGRTWP